MSNISKKSEQRGFSRITGLSALKIRLADIVLAEDNSCILFTGPKGSGKYRLSRLAAQALLCSAADSEGACEKCRSCSLFASKNHLDFRELKAEEGKKIIPTEKVRSEIKDLFMSPRLGKNKLLLVEADSLNEQGQNALLKAIEEPLPHSRIVLYCSDLSKLLPTVRSRVVNLRLDRRSEEEIFLILQEEAKNRAEELELTASDLNFFASFAAGLPGRALELAFGGWFRTLRSDTADLYFSMQNMSILDLFTDGMTFFQNNKDLVDTVLEVMHSLVRDELCALWQAMDRIVNIDYKDRVISLLEQRKKLLLRIRKNDDQNLGLVRWEEEKKSGSFDQFEEQIQNRLSLAAEMIEESREAIERNVNFELVITRLLLQLKLMFTNKD